VNTDLGPSSAESIRPGPNDGDSGPDASVRLQRGQIEGDKVTVPAFLFQRRCSVVQDGAGSGLSGARYRGTVTVTLRLFPIFRDPKLVGGPVARWPGLPLSLATAGHEPHLISRRFGEFRSRRKEVYMRRCNSKLQSFLMIVVAFAAVGCASSAPCESGPARPEFATDQQITLAEACEAIHSCCTRSCSDTRGASNVPEPENAACLNACNSSLEECYRTCK
jgi:hypothetical protein